MKKIIILSLTLLLLGSPVLASTESDINLERTKVGLPKLTIYSGLQQSAIDKVLDMIKWNYFAHTSPAGKSFTCFIINKGIRFAMAGEILARGYSGAELIKAWMSSPAHKAVILDRDFNKVGCYSKQGLTACHFIK